MVHDSGKESENLDQLRYLNERLLLAINQEMSRGDRAESKAVQMITFCGAGAAIVSAFAIAMLGGKAPCDETTVVFVAALAVFLTKSTGFSLIAIRPIMKFQEDPSALIEERMNQDYPTNLQADIELRLWLYKKAVPVHSRKLFYLDRAVINFAVGVIVALVATVLLIFTAFLASMDEPVGEVMHNVSTVIAGGSLVLAFTLELLINIVDDKWTVPRSRGPNLND